MAAGLVSGCASVKIAMPGSDQEVQANQTANTPTRQTGQSDAQSNLTTAARQLQQTPWPEIDAPTTNERLTGMIFGTKDSENSFTQKDAEKFYLISLQAKGHDQLALVQADADRSLKQARQLAEYGRQIARMKYVSSTDMETLESAIGDVRECRDVYVNTLKSLKAEGYSIDSSHWQEMRNAFNQAINDMGVTADMLAQNLNQDNAAPQYVQTRTDITP